MRKPGRKAFHLNFVDVARNNINEIAAMRQIGFRWKIIYNTFSTNQIVLSVTSRTFSDTCCRLLKSEELDQNLISRLIRQLKTDERFSSILKSNNIDSTSHKIGSTSNEPSIVAKHQMSATAAGISNSFIKPNHSAITLEEQAPRFLNIGSDGKAVDMDRRARSSAKKGNRFNAGDLINDFGFSHELAQLIMKVGEPINIAFPKMLWQLKRYHLDEQKKYGEILRMQPECKPFLHLLDNGTRSYEEAVWVLNKESTK